MQTGNQGRRRAADEHEPATTTRFKQRAKEENLKAALEKQTASGYANAEPTLSAALSIPQMAKLPCSVPDSTRNGDCTRKHLSLAERNGYQYIDDENANAETNNTAAIS